ncbi:hypothetical protein VTK56DRAFT_1730 [Thermocarpiscus australiensis]
MSSTPFQFPPCLPPEIVTKILIQNLSQGPTCVFDLLCPEWNLCRRANPGLESILRVTRVDTYTLPAAAHQPDSAGPGPGQVSTTFDHHHHHHHHNAPEDDHICLPRMRDPRRLAEGLPPFYRRELVREWAGKSVVVVAQRLTPVGPLWVRLPKEVLEELVILREVENVGLLPFEDDFEEVELDLRGVDGDGDVGGGGEAKGRRQRGGLVCSVDGREKDRLPSLGGGGCLPEGDDDQDGGDGPRYLFQHVRHLVLNTVPQLAELGACDVGTMPSVWRHDSILNLVRLEDRLVFERKANLLLRWNALERLESLFLDLRGYSHPKKRYLCDEDVVDIATSLWGKGLKLLVVAGLRSWSWYPGPEPLGIEEVQAGTWDPEWGAWVDERKAGMINWWRMFEKAVRPGGRLVFVDKQRGDEVKLLRPRSNHMFLDY